MTPNFDRAKPTVKPLSGNLRKYPVVALSAETALTEQGERLFAEQVIEALPTMEPTLFVKLGAADFVADLDEVFSKSHPSSWQWRAMPQERNLVGPDGARVAARVSVAVNFFGFQSPRTYHRIIDPVTMYGHSLNKIWPGEDAEIVKLLQWGVTLRNWCFTNGLDIRPTIGGIGAQVLRHPRFYPKARRKVPIVINQRIRENLPGNHYRLEVYPRNCREFTAYYLDQHRAHHYHARTTHFPDADHLYAHGRFTDLGDICFQETSDGFCGLYCLDLELPPRGQRSFVWINHRQLEKAFVYSNELHHLLDMGYRIKGVRAAWGSRHRDSGMSKIGRWAEHELDTYANAPWLKPLLLATYGTLACRPDFARSVYRLAKKGESVTLHTGHHSLTGKLVTTTRKLEPGIANVLHRGMIEAACRSESIGLAQWLTHLNHRVLSIYADAVIVEVDDDKQLPELPEPWRLKRTLNHLQFINQQAFISGEMTKLPGVGREIKNYRQARPGYAPRKVLVEALTGQEIVTNRRI